MTYSPARHRPVFGRSRQQVAEQAAELVAELAGRHPIPSPEVAR